MAHGLVASHRQRPSRPQMLTPHRVRQPVRSSGCSRVADGRSAFPACCDLRGWQRIGLTILRLPVRSSLAAVIAPRRLKPLRWGAWSRAIAEVPSPPAALSWPLLVGRRVLAPTRRQFTHPFYSRSWHLRSRSAAGQRALHVSRCRRCACLMPGHVFPATWPRGVTASTLDSESSDRCPDPREALLRGTCG